MAFVDLPDNIIEEWARLYRLKMISLMKPTKVELLGDDTDDVIGVTEIKALPNTKVIRLNKGLNYKLISQNSLDINDLRTESKVLPYKNENYVIKDGTVRISLHEEFTAPTSNESFVYKLVNETTDVELVIENNGELKTFTKSYIRHFNDMSKFER